MSRNLAQNRTALQLVQCLRGERKISQLLSYPRNDLHGGNLLGTVIKNNSALTRNGSRLEPMYRRESDGATLLQRCHREHEVYAGCNPPLARPLVRLRPQNAELLGTWAIRFSGRGKRHARRVGANQPLPWSSCTVPRLLPRW